MPELAADDGQSCVQCFLGNRLYFKGTFNEAKIKGLCTISVNTVSTNTYLKLK